LLLFPFGFVPDPKVCLGLLFMIVLIVLKAIADELEHQFGIQP
jgi:hypothetical protein